MGIIEVNVTEGYVEDEGARIVSPCSNFTVTIGGPDDLTSSINGGGNSATFSTATTTNISYVVFAAGHPALTIQNDIAVGQGFLNSMLCLHLIVYSLFIVQFRFPSPTSRRAPAATTLCSQRLFTHIPSIRRTTTSLLLLSRPMPPWPRLSSMASRAIPQTFHSQNHRPYPFH